MPNENYNVDFVLVREMAKAFAEESFDCEKTRGLVNTSVGETQNAHRLILNDHLWRLQDKIGKLWFYVSGSADFEVMVRNELNKQKDEIDLKTIEEKNKPTENIVENTNTNEQSA
jgi:hypothetical protein